MTEHDLITLEKIRVLCCLNLKGGDDVDEYIKSNLKTTAPQTCGIRPRGIWWPAVCSSRQSNFYRVGTLQMDYSRALLVRLAVYFSFNLKYDDQQKFMFGFLEEYVLGLKPLRKSLRYSKFCNNIFVSKSRS